MRRQEDWWIVPRGDTVAKSKLQYGLLNETIGQHLVYGSRTWGINLVWQAAMPRNVRFERPDGCLITLHRIASVPTLKYGDRIAIFIDKGGFLGCRDRSTGINLGWFDEPQYEWELRGGEADQPVNSAQPVSIFNHTARDFLLYCERTWGINLRWANNCPEKETAPVSTAASLIVWVLIEVGDQPPSRPLIYRPSSRAVAGGCAPVRNR
jgi:hypothetical protein